MPITGTEPSLTEARIGMMRVGGARVGYVLPIPAITINGTIRTGNVRIDGCSVRDILNGTPNTATMRVSGFTPTEGHEVIVAFGTSPIQFRGRILSTNKVYELKPANLAWDCQCISEEWLLNRRKVTMRYTSQSATAIIQDIFTNYTSGFSTAGVASGLPTLDEITFTNEDVTDCLDRICQRIGDDWQLDYAKVLHVPAADGLAVNAITDSNDHGMSGIAVTTDLSQLKTRQSGEGGGSNAAVEIAVGATTLPVIEDVWYQVSGGTVKSGPQIITYIGKSAVAGTGTTVAGKPLTPGAMTAAMVAGTSGGLSVGAYLYRATFVTPLGESDAGTASGSTSITGVSAPGALTDTVSSGTAGNLGVGTYSYKVTYVTSVGETEAGTASGGETIAHVTAPSGWSSAGNTGGSMTTGHTYAYALTYTTAVGETTNDIIHEIALTGGNTKVDFSSLPTSSDGRVNGRKLYRVDYTEGAWRLVTTLNNADTTYSDTAANSSLIPLMAPGVNTTGSGQMSLTSIPTSGDGRVTARRLYRTAVNGSAYKFLTTIGNNTATTHTDNAGDGSLGADAPSVNESGSGQMSLTGIPLGPTGTTARRLYRTEVGGSVYKALATIPNNTGTTYTDTIADTRLGEESPSMSQVGSTAGDTTLRVAELSVFDAAGGWVQAANQLLRFTGRSGSSGEGTITGIPASGVGAMAAAVSAGSAVINAPFLSGVSGVLYTIPQGEPVNIWVTRNDTAAQTFMAAAVGGDGIHEADPIQDRRMSFTEITARCDAKLEELTPPLVTVRYLTRDITTQSGRDVTITLGAPTSISGTFRIQSVTTTGFRAVALASQHGVTADYRPMRQAEASSRRLSFEQILRVLKKDT